MTRGPVALVVGVFLISNTRNFTSQEIQSALGICPLDHSLWIFTCKMIILQIEFQESG